jgi:hypothetical protein
MQTVQILAPLAVLALFALALGVLFHALLARFVRSPGLWTRAAAIALGSVAAGGLFVALLPAVPDRWLRPEPRGDLDQADAFVAFALGLGQSAEGQPTPGQSNRAIARWLVEHNPHHRPAIVQEGVYLALKELEGERPALRVDGWVTRLPHRPDVYVDTSGAALQTWAVLEVKGCRRPALVAHDLHLQRMVWTFDQLGLSDAVVPDLPAMPFDPNSPQHPGTRSRTGWLAWELLLARPLAVRPRSSLLVALLGVALLAAVWRLRGRAGKG